MINNSKNYNLTLEKYKLAVKNLDINHMMSQYNQIILDEIYKIPEKKFRFNILNIIEA